MNTSPTSRTQFALIIFAVITVLGWWVWKNIAPGSDDVANHRTLMLQKSIPIGFVKSEYAAANPNSGGNTLQTYMKIERDKPSVSHKLHSRNGNIVADEYIFERTNAGALMSERIVTDIGFSDAIWTDSSLTVLDWKAMKLKSVPLFRTSKGTYDAALYEADGVARLVVCNRFDPNTRIADFVMNASLPDEGVQEGLKQADRVLPK